MDTLSNSEMGKYFKKYLGIMMRNFAEDFIESFME